MASRIVLKKLSTAAEVTAALGGVAGVAGLTGAFYRRAWDWEAREQFPARYFLVMWTELIRRGAYAPPELWGQAAIPRERTALLASVVRKAVAA